MYAFRAWGLVFAWVVGVCVCVCCRVVSWAGLCPSVRGFSLGFLGWVLVFLLACFVVIGARSCGWPLGAMCLCILLWVGLVQCSYLGQIEELGFAV